MDAKILQIILRAKDEASKTIESVTKSVEKSTTTMDRVSKTLKVTGATMVATGAAASVAIYKMGESGAKLYDLEKSFEALSKTAGVSMDTLLSDLKKATAGTIDNAALIENSVRATMLGIPIEKMSGLFAIARQQSIAMGEDLGFMLDSIVKGIGRASPMILDNLGITISLGEVYENAAKKLNKKVEALTKAEQQQALTNAVLEWGAKKEKELGGVVTSNADSYSRMSAAITNTKNELSKLYYDLMAPFVEKISALVTRLNEVDPQMLKFIASFTALSAVGFIVVGAIVAFIGFLPALAAGITLITSVSAGMVLLFGGIVVATLAVIAAFVAWKQNTMGFRDKVIAAFERVKSTIINTIETIKAKVKQWKEDFGSFIDDVVSGFKSFPSRVREQLNIWVEDAKSASKAWIEAMWNRTNEFIKSIPERIVEGYNRLMWAMIEYDIATISRWGTHLDKIGETLEAWFAMLPNKFAMWYANTTLAMITWYDETRTMIIDKLNSWGEAIEVWFVMLPDRIKMWLANTWVTMTTWFAEVRAGIDLKLAEWELSFQTWFDSLPEKFNTWFTNLETSITNWLTGFGERFATWWKSLGEKSPESLYDGWKSRELTMAGKIVAGIIAFIGVVLVTLVVGLIDVGIKGVEALFDAMKWAFDNGKTAIYNKVNEIIDTTKQIFVNLKEDVKNTISTMITDISNLLYSIKIPKFKVEFDTKNIGGFDVKVPSIKMYQFGGLVPNSGLAYLHAGEFVMSRGMLEGRRAMPPSVNNSYQQPISINIYGSDVNAGQLGYTLAWQLRNSR